MVLKNIRRKPEKFRSSLIIGYETTRSTSLGYVEFHVTRCQSKSRAKWFQEKLLLRSRPTFWREETNIQPRPRHR